MIKLFKYSSNSKHSNFPFSIYFNIVFDIIFFCYAHISFKWTKKINKKQDMLILEVQAREMYNLRNV